MQSKYVPPSVKESAFSCPHCGALTTQYWFDLHADGRKDNSPPTIWNKEDDEYKKIEQQASREDECKVIFEHIKKRALGQAILERDSSGSYIYNHIINGCVTKCYHCKQLAFWLYDKMIWPVQHEGPAANPDLPADIRLDFDEASRILKISPRGAAALLRLCIQKLCIYIGEKGKNINDDIASLVAKGLPQKVQQALDVVRVVGNDAVHPGQIDLRDDYSTAYMLFDLVNFISDIFITQYKKIDEIYSNLPPDKLEGIEIRNQKAVEKNAKS